MTGAWLVWERTLESQHSEGRDRKTEEKLKGASSKIKINEKRRGKRGEEGEESRKEKWGERKGTEGRGTLEGRGLGHNPRLLSLCLHV